jgi:hypothetical protein
MSVQGDSTVFTRMQKLWVSTFEKGIIGGEDGGPAAIFSPKTPFM